jgi:hypothetical protein
VRWDFRIRATTGERTPSRVLHVLDVQQAEPSDLQLIRFSDNVHMQFVIATEESKASRIGLLLRRLESVFSVLWTPISENATIRCMERLALSLYSSDEAASDTNPDSDFWKIAPSIWMRTNNYGQPVPGHQTEVRLRWTDQNLYFLFLCPYQDLQVREGTPLLDRATPQLWRCDVAEVFVGRCSDFMQRYCEFETSPRGEWLDLQIETPPQGGIAATALRSGFSTSARIEEEKGQWFALLRIPYHCVNSGRPVAGARLRLNFFRSQGRTPVEIAWQPTYDASFHLPSRFGTLLLVT